MVCNVVTSTTPIVTMPLLEETPMHQTIPAVLQQVAILDRTLDPSLSNR
jgi:hypothetical protein